MGLTLSTPGLVISSFQLYDHDKDGILNFKETRNVLRCLGLIVDEVKVNVPLHTKGILLNKPYDEVLGAAQFIRLKHSVQ